MTRIVDNEGIGALYATAVIKQTAGVFDLSEEHVGTAVCLDGNNTISHGVDGGGLLGCLEYVAGGYAAVQIGGVARLPVSTAKTAPAVGNRVVVDGAGAVYQAPTLTDVPAGGAIGRGVVLRYDAESGTCDVLL
ncbi:MAG: hypothetical protein RBU29_03135 [bacterium]|jgi:hypothetical protein|nr:hypothetical protein [bacterium]